MPPPLFMRLLAATVSPSASPGGSSGKGIGYVVLGVILVGAFLLSTWRLRRDR